MIRIRRWLAAFLMLTLVCACAPEEDSVPKPESSADIGKAAWTPPVGASFHIQYVGEVDLDLPVDIYNLDGERTTPDQVRHLTARGVHAICYFNAGAWEDWRTDKDAFPKEVIGRPLDGWPGEFWLDIRRLDVLVPIMAERMEVCRSKGFVAVDPDNTDGWQQKTGFAINRQHQIAYQRALAVEAHRRGLAIGLKNNIEQLDQMASIVDFAVNEQCVQYRECDAYAEFLASGKAVFNVEYRGTRAKVCPGRPTGMSTVITDRALTGIRTACD